MDTFEKIQKYTEKDSRIQKCLFDIESCLCRIKYFRKNGDINFLPDISDEIISNLENSSDFIKNYTNVIDILYSNIIDNAMKEHNIVYSETDKYYNCKLCTFDFNDLKKHIYSRKHQNLFYPFNGTKKL